MLLLSRHRALPGRSGERLLRDQENMGMEARSALARRARSRRPIAMVAVALLAIAGYMTVTATAGTSKPNPGGVQAQDVQMSSSGPLNNIWISPQLNCQVDHVGDSDHEF